MAAAGYPRRISSNGEKTTVFHRFRLVLGLVGLVFFASACSAFFGGGSGGARAMLAVAGVAGFTLGWWMSSYITRLEALPLWAASLVIPPLALAALGWLVVVMTSTSSTEYGDALGFVLLTSPIWLLVAVPCAFWTARNERQSIW